MKHWKYLKYVLRHKWWVAIFLMRLKPTPGNLWRAIIHDASKFYPSEWSPYVEYFYGPTVAMKNNEPDDYRYWCARTPVEAAFNHAWNAHQKRNKHHWQFWLLTMDSGEARPLQMPEKYVYEMIADWKSAGYYITGKIEVMEWYTKNRDRIQLQEKTREHVEVILAIDARSDGLRTVRSLRKFWNRLWSR